MVAVGGPLLGQFLLFMVVHAQTYPWLEQISRQELLSSRCGNLKSGGPKVHARDLDHLLVDQEHRVLYCYVPKVACTNWKRIFMVLGGKWSRSSPLVEIPGSLAHADNSTTRLSQLHPQKISRYLKDYTAFIMVRHPFERLLSAYRNKFENTYSHYFQLRYGRDIIKKYRKNASDFDLEHGSNVTFREFVRFVLDEGANANEHWTPVYDLCFPCSLNYSFVGHYETLTEDSRALLNLVGAPDVDFPYTKSKNTGRKLRSYFQQLSMGEIKKLYKLYEFDFKLFGYTLEDLLGFELG